MTPNNTSEAAISKASARAVIELRHALSQTRDRLRRTELLDTMRDLHEEAGQPGAALMLRQACVVEYAMARSLFTGVYDLRTSDTVWKFDRWCTIIYIAQVPSHNGYPKFQINLQVPAGDNDPEPTYEVITETIGLRTGGDDLGPHIEELFSVPISSDQEAELWKELLTTLSCETRSELYNDLADLALQRHDHEQGSALKWLSANERYLARDLPDGFPAEAPDSYLRPCLDTLIVTLVVLIVVINSHRQLFGSTAPTMMAAAISALGTLGVVDLVSRWDDRRRP